MGVTETVAGSMKGLGICPGIVRSRTFQNVNKRYRKQMVKIQVCTSNRIVIKSAHLNFGGVGVGGCSKTCFKDLCSTGQKHHA